MDGFIGKIAEKLETLLADSEYFIVDMAVKPTHNYKIYLDGDSPLTISAIAKINRTLRNQIDEENWFPEGDYSLEISSPGVDTPLKINRQYYKHVGRTLEVVLTDQAENPIEGKLLEVSPTGITLEQKGDKKTPDTIHTLLFDAIKTAIVKVSFK